MDLLGDSSAIYIQQVEDVHISHGSIANQKPLLISLKHAFVGHLSYTPPSLVNVTRGNIVLIVFK